MDEWTVALITFFSLIALSGIIWFFMKLKKNQDEIAAEIQTRFAQQKIILQDQWALHIGQESRGYSQTKGNGPLILGENDLFFALRIPKRIFVIPRTSLLSIERTKRCCGKNILKMLLKINYRDSSGKPDALAFYVKELDLWERELLKSITP